MTGSSFKVGPLVYPPIKGVEKDPGPFGGHRFETPKGQNLQLKEPLKP